MKNIILGFIFLQMPLILFAQSPNERFTISYQNLSLQEAIVDLEQKSNYRFYYLSEWLDSLTINARFENEPLSSILDSLLSATTLHYTFYQKRIILSQDLPISTELPPNFFGEKSDSSTSKPEEETVPLGYIFSREYKPEVKPQNNQVEQIIEIGEKAKMRAGKSATIAGYIREKDTGEPIIGASVYVDALSRGASSNIYGFYSLSLPSGSHVLKVQYTGMKTTEKSIVVYSNGKLDISLENEIVALKEVIVEADQDVNVKGVQMGRNRIDIKAMKNVPKVLGENDILKILLTLPGVQSIGEGASGFNVRGGNADQNLILINQAPIYNPSHFLGFFSVFNADAIKNAELYKSSIPVEHGSRLSSILEVQMKDGNQKKFSGQGGIGPVTGRLTLEVPLKKDQSSLIIGGRATYSDWLLNQVEDEALKDSEASFYDIVARLSHKIDDKNSLYLSGYFSNDRFRLSFDSLISYQNANLSLEWRHSYSNKLLGVFSGVYSQYGYQVGFDEIPVEAFDFDFKIREANAKAHFTYYQGKNHKLDFGVQSKYYWLDPGNVQRDGGESLILEESVQQEKGLETAFYLADNIDINPKLSLYLGLRYSLFQVIGPRTVFSYLDDAPRGLNTISDTTTYSGSNILKTYHGPEYRVSTRYAVNAKFSIKASYGRTRQYIHLLSNTVSIAPTDIWKLSDEFIAPQIGDQISLGLYHNFRANTIEASIEGYYKKLQNVLDYKVGADLVLNQFIETDVIQGRGKAYGVEFLLKKKSGKLNGWLSYTYSRTFIKLDSQFPSEQVNNGNFFPANFDKPHDITLISNYKLTRRYSLSFNFTYSTGRPITYPIGQFDFGGSRVIQYSDRNQFRIPDYIRMDIGVNIEGSHKIRKLAHSFWTISIYNLLGRRNPYSIFFVVDERTVQAFQLSVFGAPIPTVTYNFRF